MRKFADTAFCLETLSPKCRISHAQTINTEQVPTKADLDETLVAAARAPSGNNIPPWQVHILRDSAKRFLTSAIMAQRSGEAGEPTPEYNYYPETWPEPYLGRRRTVGWAVLEAAGVVKGDRIGSRAWHDWNFDFFGAPVGLMFTIDRRLAPPTQRAVGRVRHVARVCGRSLSDQQASDRAGGAQRVRFTHS